MDGGTGLANETGRNRCFINVIVQCLHAYEPLRTLVAGATHASSAPATHVTLLRALKSVFAALDTAERSASAAVLHAAVTAPVIATRATRHDDARAHLVPSPLIAHLLRRQ